MKVSMKTCLIHLSYLIQSLQHGKVLWKEIVSENEYKELIQISAFRIKKKGDTITITKNKYLCFT